VPLEVLLEVLLKVLLKVLLVVLHLNAPPARPGLEIGRESDADYRPPSSVGVGAGGGSCVQRASSDPQALSVGRAVGAGVSPACSFANASVTVGEDGDERVRRTEIADEVAWTVE
jgi:hypothetical protein